MTRQPYRAGTFYPSESHEALRALKDCLKREPSSDTPSPGIAGIAPHAGWMYSGPTAGLVFQKIAQQSPLPELFLFFGAVHTFPHPQPVIDEETIWQTPLGEVQVDTGFLKRLRDQGVVSSSPLAHREEHSIEVLLPFVKHLFPQAKIAPIAVPPRKEAVPLGEAAANAAKGDGRRIVAVGSSDFTHYGRDNYGFSPAGEGEPALHWARENDERLLEKICHMQAEEVVPEASKASSACGSGAIAATVAFARALGQGKGIVLEHTNSYEVQPNGIPRNFVGYAAVVF